MAGKYGEHNKVRCSFCNKSEDQVRKLIAGPEGVYICDECIEICAEIIDEELDEYYEQDENQSGINLMKPKAVSYTHLEESTGMGELFWAFRQGQFWHIVLIMLVMKVKIFLWGLLFVIPGIVKSYEYKMIPYILAENPGLSMSRVFELRCV